MPSSRLNLARTYTIDHTVKVFPIGRLSSSHFERVRQGYIEVQGFAAAASVPHPLEELQEVEEEESEETEVLEEEEAE
jgi:hypothetical protein